MRKTILQWTPQAAAVFDKLKTVMLQLPTLALPNFEEVFDVTTDASGTGIGAILSQSDNPIAFLARNYVHVCRLPPRMSENSMQ